MEKPRVKRRSKWDRPEAEKPSFFKELKEGVQEHWPAVLAVLAGFAVFLFLVWLVTREYTGEVTGKVTYGGKPIPYGRVTFVSQSGRQKAPSGVIKNGVYKIERCPLGPVKIAVESRKAVKFDPPKGTVDKSVRSTKGTGAADSPPPEVIGQHVPIPPEYSNSDTSNLTYKVGWGSQKHDIDLPVK